MIKTGQLYTLPSGEMIRVGINVKDSSSDWSCVYRTGDEAGTQLTLTTEFLNKWAKSLC